jgi:hypothetical protein
MAHSVKKSDPVYWLWYDHTEKSSLECTLQAELRVEKEMPERKEYSAATANPKRYRA